MFSRTSSGHGPDEIRVVRGCAGFKTETVESAFHFRCVKCNELAQTANAG
jgi:hypothetical protein